MAKNGEQKKITAKNGITYVIQHPGLRESVKIKDRAKNQFGVQQNEVLYEEIMKNCIFIEGEGNATFDHFEEHGGFTEVLTEAIQFVFQEG